MIHVWSSNTVWTVFLAAFLTLLRDRNTRFCTTNFRRVLNIKLRFYFDQDTTGILDEVIFSVHFKMMRNSTCSGHFIRLSLDPRRKSSFGNIGIHSLMGNFCTHLSAGFSSLCARLCIVTFVLLLTVIGVIKFPLGRTYSAYPLSLHVATPEVEIRGNLI